MVRHELGDLAAFAVVAQERSFTRAAARLGTSQSALSQVVRRLERGAGFTGTCLDMVRTIGYAS